MIQDIRQKPFVFHPGLLPVVMSFKTLAPVEKKNGFRKQSAGLLTTIRRSFSGETTLANTG